MQVTDLKHIMELSAGEVLEAMCFISSEGIAEEAARVSPEWICGELDFFGYVSGSFGIAVPPSTAATIAVNFLGEDESTSSTEQTMEVVCELTNMICGTLLAQLDSKSVFTLSPPRPGCFLEGNAGDSERSDCILTLDEGFIASWLLIRTRS